MPIIDPRLNDPNCAADVTEDFNRVLNIVDGKSALPEIEEGDAGKVLTVNADEDAAVWATPGGGGSSGGSTEIVIADTQTVSGTVIDESTVDYSLTPTADYADPSMYINKMLRAEVTRDGVTSVLTGQVYADEFQGETFIGTNMGFDCFSDAIGYIGLSDGAITFSSFSSTADELTIKLEVVPSASLLVTMNTTTQTLSVTWQEIYNALIVQGRPVLIDGCPVSNIYYDPDDKYFVETIHVQGGGAASLVYNASTSDDYPVYQGD